jgi:putative resolvase
MRLSQYAKQMNVSYKTAFRWWKAGRLDAYQLDIGTIIIRDPLPETPTPNGIALYMRFLRKDRKPILSEKHNGMGTSLHGHLIKKQWSVSTPAKK